MRIDAHAHAQPPEYLDALLASGRYEATRDAQGRIVVRERGSRFLTITPQMHYPEARVAEMDAAGIDMQILSVTTPQVYFLQGQAAVDLARRCNDYLAGIVQRYPHRFRALASVPLTADPDAAVGEFVRCLDELGMVGAIVGANVDGRPLDDPAFDAFYAAADRRGTTLFIHPMVPAGIEVMQAYALAPLVGFMFDTTLAVARLIFSGFFERYPRVKVLVGHLGAAVPYLAGRLDVGWRSYPDCQGIPQPPSAYLGRLYLDTVSFHAPALDCARATVGADHLVFGSDYPHVIGDVGGALASIQAALPAADHDAVLGRTAAALFGVPCSPV
ncbi:MAG: amidohydrolase family protein [Acetobacteraceae bacterium]|nr:amidohydrolase family protein [Acetobacteraceae bacterium]MDI3307284.1 amidohydrolase family protein [Acetobacteraceae bacterium]